MQPSISVVLGTKDRPDVLQGLLHRLSEMHVNLVWELIVVDNSPARTADTVCERFKARLPLKYLHLAQPGKSMAMNHAIKQTDGDIILFTDDDVVPHAGWIDELHQAAMAHEHINIFGGRIQIDESGVPAWIRRSYNLKTILFTLQDYDSSMTIYGRETSLIGPNIAIRRKVLDGMASPWPVNMGPGTSLPVGDEPAFLNKVSLASDSGARLYVPASVVVHHFNREHIRFHRALARCFQGGYAAGMIARYFNLPALAPRENATGLFDRYKSIREFVCVIARTIGVIVGYYLTSAGRRRWYISPESEGQG